MLDVRFWGQGRERLCFVLGFFFFFFHLGSCSRHGPSELLCLARDLEHRLYGTEYRCCNVSLPSESSAALRVRKEPLACEQMGLHARARTHRVAPLLAGADPRHAAQFAECVSPQL